MDAHITEDGERRRPRVEVTRNGPYVVHGALPLRRMRAVVSEHDEPMTWQTSEPLAIDDDDEVFLCRCGGSANKPFCDGTHERRGFDGTEAAPTSIRAERAVTMTGTRIVVHDDRSICEHAGFCGNRLTNVWDMLGGSGTADSVVRAQVMSMIEHCPSGALTFRLAPDEPDVEPNLAAAVGVVDDGPLFLTGGAPVERADGKPFETRNRVTLCRCGQSAIKPLCDGSHERIGFRDRADGPD